MDARLFMLSPGLAEKERRCPPHFIADERHLFRAGPFAYADPSASAIEWRRLIYCTSWRQLTLMMALC